MKQLDYKGITVFKSNSFDEIKKRIKEPLPDRFRPEVLKLLKDTNPFLQEYYYAYNEEHFAFFVTYQSKMNILTLGKNTWNMNVTTIGYPCSLSCPGYYTDDLNFLLVVSGIIKGARLILNVPDLAKDKEGKVRKPSDLKMGFGETLPTCMFTCSFQSIEEYMNALRSPYRRRLRLAIKYCKEAGIEKTVETMKTEETIQIVSRDINITDTEAVNTKTANAKVANSKAADDDIYPLYLNTYEKSDYKLEKMEPDFFRLVKADKIIYQKDGKPVGFTLLRMEGTHLDFMLCGMDYSMKTADLYYYMLLNIIEYAIHNHCETIDFGQTSEQTKLKFGAHLEKRYYYAAHTNPFLNLFARYGNALLEYKYDFPDYKVMKQ